MQFIRRRRQKTDYVQRFGLLKSGKPRIVIRRSLNNFRVQVISYKTSGDATLVDTFSKNLKKYGWKGHGGNVTAAYLTGLLAGRLASKQGVSEGVVDIGLQKSVRGSSLYAAAMGVKDSGIKVSLGKEVMPSKDRVTGKHVAQYAEKMKKEDAEKYRKHFASYLKVELNPEDLPKHFEEVKAQIEKG